MEELESDSQVFFMVDEEKISPSPAASQLLNTISTRKNLNETAFFYPHLLTNEDGEIIINFTVPETLTKWKMLGFAHTKDLKTGLIGKTLVTSKDLMVVPNLPRFLREGDKITLTSKIVNLSDKKLEGRSQLMFFDALTMNPIDDLLKNNSSQKAFLAEAGQSTLVSWEIEVPVGIQAVACRVVAQSGDFTDGEEKVMPVLSNRMLVTETLPVWVKQGQTKTFTLDKLVNTTSETWKNHALTLEFTANPAWYAIQALPYMMEYPYECIEQTFSRFYANAIASFVINTNPKIKRVFDAWKSENNGDAFLSKLEQNQELKNVLIEETPWVLDAQNETEKNKRIALLFDLNKMNGEQEKAILKLKQGQYPSGGWPWFEGGKENRYITQHIVSGLGHLRKLNVFDAEKDPEVWQMLEKAIHFLDNELLKEYNQIKKDVKKEDLPKNHLSDIAVYYLYGRSFFKEIPLNEEVVEAVHYFKEQAGTFWLKQNNYIKGLTALALFRDGQKEIPLKIVKSLNEHATHSDELGMFWKTQWGYYWHESAVETQSLMIELFDEVAQNKTAVDELRVWLLKNKQTNNWKTTKATAEACYALLLGGTNWLATENKVTFEIGGKKLEPEKDETLNIQAGTGYFKKVWHENEITPEMGKITISKPDPGISWGGLYWQYFEQLDKITSAETPLKIEKKLFKEVQTEGAKTIEPIDDLHKLSVGDKVIVRVVLSTDRDMEFVHLKDLRASCFEPVNVLSGYQYQDGLGYYQSVKDASMN
ncbi:MAG TPA: alpha-2-macroglobulin family protein, partial [Draconibacterium sp.]|nr:alpha-2-macroglobulin family protein [Draconibacterium sp.]